MYGNRSFSSLGVRGFHYQPPSIASYRDLAMSAVVIHCRKSYYKEHTMDSSRRRGSPRKSRKDSIKEWTGQSMSSLLRIADNKVDRQPSQPMHLSEYPQQRLGITGIS